MPETTFTYHQIPIVRRGSRLIAPDDDLVLRAADQPLVEWIFTDLLSGEIPDIFFPPAASLAGTAGAPNPLAAPFGPFAFLSRQAARVTAKGLRATVSAFRYQPAVWRTNEGGVLEQVASGELITVRIEAPAEPFPAEPGGREILVTQVAGGRQLEVEPQFCELRPGEPVIWRFRLPAKLFEDPLAPWIPAIQFAGSGATRPGLGPFSRMSILNLGMEGEMGVRLVVGSGASGAMGRFHYHAVAHSVDRLHVVESSPDPVVDNEGEPAGGGN